MLLFILLSSLQGLATSGIFFLRIIKKKKIFLNKKSTKDQHLLHDAFNNELEISQYYRDADSLPFTKLSLIPNLNLSTINDYTVFS